MEKFKLFNAPLGTRFRYKADEPHTYVLLSYEGAGRCCEDPELVLNRYRTPHGRFLQGAYTVSDSRAEFEALEVYPPAPAPVAQGEPVAWLYDYTDADGDCRTTASTRDPLIVYAHELHRVSNVRPLAWACPTTPAPVASPDKTDWKAIARVQSAKLHVALDRPGARERLQAVLQETSLDAPAPVAQPQIVGWHCAGRPLQHKGEAVSEATGQEDQPAAGRSPAPT